MTPLHPCRVVDEATDGGETRRGFHGCGWLRFPYVSARSADAPFHGSDVHGVSEIPLPFHGLGAVF
eukprot:COSAG01_NODE_23_length_37704_cov_30.005877_18_plen_66_part_00